MADVDAWMPLWIGDYLADTGDLSTEEHGAYLLLLMAAWRAGGKLPGDPDRLARHAKVHPRRWPPIWNAIGRFFDISGDSVIQGRLVLELEAAVKRKETARSRGRKGAEAKTRARLEQAETKQSSSGGKPPAPGGDGEDLGSIPGSESESGSGSVPPPLSVSDPGEKTAPAREPEPEPNDIRLPPGEVTEYGIAKTFGFVRGREWPNAFPWTIPRSSPEKAAGIVTDANDDPDVRDDLVPTMVLLFAKAKAGKLGAKNIDDATVAFGWWVSKFTALREELHGRNSGPDDGKPVDPYCDDHRKPGSRGRRARRYSETCPECRHVAALNRTPSNGEPVTAAALLARGGS